MVAATPWPWGSIFTAWHERARPLRQQGAGSGSWGTVWCTIGTSLNDSQLGVEMGMGQYLYIPFLVGWTSINPSYFDVNYRGTIGFDTLPNGLKLWAFQSWDDIGTEAPQGFSFSRVNHGWSCWYWNLWWLGDPPWLKNPPFVAR